MPTLYTWTLKTDVAPDIVGIVQIPGRSYISLTLVMFLMFVYRICLMP